MKMDKGIISLVLFGALLGANPISTGAEENHRMLVVFEEQVDGAQAKEAVEEAGGKLIENYEEVTVASVEMSARDRDRLLEDPAVKYAEEDAILELQDQKEEWGIGSSNIQAAWNSGFTGKGVKVAVIDSGIAEHPDLRIAGGTSTVSYTKSYADDQGHGTHVAGIIGALNNDFGVKGVAFNAQLYAVKAFNAKGQAYASDVIEGINWSVANGIDIINISAGFQKGSSAFQTAADQAYEKGLLIVAAAGNDGNDAGTGDSVDFPARYASVIAVAAVDQNSNRAPFSSTGDSVEVSAPGVGILSTSLGNQYVAKSGTSMAAPYVVGELALIKEAYPALSNKEHRQVLIEHTRDAGEKGKDPLYGYGIIKASDFKVPVTAKAENKTVKLEVDKTEVSGLTGDTVNLKVSAIHENGNVKNATDQAIWESSNSKVATAAKGTISLKSEGTAIISAVYGGQTVKVPVTVFKTTMTGSSPNFSDVKPFYAPAVGYLFNRHITQGKSNVEFGVDDLIIRADAAIWLAKELELDTNSAKPSGFNDVPARAAGAVNALKQAGIIGGKTATRSGAGDPLTRGEIAIILQRAYRLEAGQQTSVFTGVSPRYAEAVNALVAKKVTNGVAADRFGVTSKITRGQLAVFIYRLAE